jgi:hypothetical protein
VIETVYKIFLRVFCTLMIRCTEMFWLLCICWTDQLKNLRVDDRILLKRGLKKLCMVVWSRFIGKQSSDELLCASYLHLAPRLRMSGAIPLLLLYAFMTWSGTKFYELLRCFVGNILLAGKIYSDRLYHVTQKGKPMCQAQHRCPA